MAVGKTQFTIKNLNEERQFTNPHVRFIRRRGRIIPIVNKKRIGQDVSGVGAGLMKKGLLIGAATLLVKKTKIGKAILKPLSKFSMKGSFLNTKAGDGFKMKSAKAMIKMSGKATKFAAKNSGKIGLGALGLGLTSKVVGDELQARSAFGKDFFFTVDRQGRGS